MKKSIMFAFVSIGHGKVIVEVAQGGFTGASIANIFQEDGHSSLRYMGSLSCR